VRVVADDCIALQGYCTLETNTIAGLFVVFVIVHSVLVTEIGGNALSVIAFTCSTYLCPSQRLYEEPLQEVHHRDGPQQLRRNAQPDFDTHVVCGRVRCFVVCVAAVSGDTLRCLWRRYNGSKQSADKSSEQQRQDIIKTCIRRS